MLNRAARENLDTSDVPSRQRGIFLERRFEKRTLAPQSCRLSMMHPLSHDAVLFEEGTGVTVNHSQSGMLLLMSSAPAKGKLLEVHTRGFSLRPACSLVEVRWTKPVRESSEGLLHLVGCRLTFGPSRYWAF
jgi:hypothetical protein